ncbi:MAG: hypothetical protein QM758_30275 [Armatimonas sp.]
MRSGVDPVKALQMLKGRVHGSHLKELNKMGPDGGDAPCGTGNALALGVLEELRRQKVAGAVSVEYETDFGQNTAEIGQCIGFARGWAQAGKNIASRSFRKKSARCTGQAFLFGKESYYSLHNHPP